MSTDSRNIMFKSRLESWIPVKRNLDSFFNNEEMERLSCAAGNFNAEKRTIVFLAFENKHVFLGGLSAVARYLPVKLAGRGERVLILSPFYGNNTGMQKALDSSALSIVFEKKDIEIAGKKTKMTLYMDSAEATKEYYIEIKGYFSAVEHPYSYSDPALLAADALAFCQAVPHVLQLLNLKSDIVLHANDWETALVSITSKLAVIKGLLLSVKTILTLHNSFDIPLPSNAAVFFNGRALPFATALECAIPFLDGPLTTVSQAFARELLFDPLQNGYFCNHLQEFFAMNSPAGIENGIFGVKKKIFSEKAVLGMESGNLKFILEEKKTYINGLHSVIAKVDDKRKTGSLSFEKASSFSPVFFMSGRMDQSQKGFDVMFRAFSLLPAGSAKLLFCPANPDVSSLDFFLGLAAKHKGDICILPYRLSSGVYNACLRGAGFLVMPSLYEPFGSVNEGYLHATPVIARATGGLWAQVNSVCPCNIPDFYGNVFKAFLKGKSGSPSGILFREDGAFSNDAAEWRRLMRMPVEERTDSALYRSMVTAALEALKTAIKIYRHGKEYAELIAGGQKLIDNDGWSDAVYSYRKVYDTASRINAFD
jgi:glycogen synthase